MTQFRRPHGDDSTAMTPARAWSGRVTRLEVTDSTNERALSAIARGEALHGDVFVARQQTRGRGRRGATWHSPAGEGLYLSVALLPARPASPPALTMASGIAAWRALRGLGLSGVELEWPNDLFARAPASPDRAKLVGILVETRGLDASAPHYVVGVGINVAQRSFPPELLAERAVTSLALCGLDTTVEAVLQRVLAELEPALELALSAPETVAREYAVTAGLLTGGLLTQAESPATAGPTETHGSLGAAVRVEGPAGPIEGRVGGLGIACGLILVDATGHERRVPLEHVRSLEKL